MQRIPRDLARKYAFDWRDEPLLRVQPGESFEVETWDAGTGYFKTPADKAMPGQRPGFDRVPPLANPIAGPVYRRGGRARRHPRRHASRRSSSATPRGSPSARGAGRWANRRAIRSCRATTRPRSSATRPARRHDARRHAALQRQDLLADHAVHRHARRGPGPRGDDEPRRPGRVGRQPRHPRRAAPATASCCRCITRGRCSTSATSTPARATPNSPAPPPRRPPTVRLRFDWCKGKTHPLDAHREAGQRWWRSTPTGRWRWRSRRRRCT